MATDPNQNFKVLLKRGHIGLRVVLRKKPRQDVEPSGPSGPSTRGMIRRQRRPDSLYGKRKSKSGINFYDMGQRKITGVFVDNPDLTVAPSVGGTIPVPANNLTSTDWDTLRDNLLGITSRASNFKRIVKTESDRYGLLVDINNTGIYATIESANPDFLDSGYSYTGPLTNIAFQSLQGIIPNWDTNNTTDFKITSTPTYSDSAVALSLTGLIDVFLAPTIAVHSVVGDWIGSLPTVGYNYDGAYFDLAPRSLLNLNDGSSAFVTGVSTDSVDLATYKAYIQAHLDTLKLHIGGGGGPGELVTIGTGVIIAKRADFRSIVGSVAADCGMKAGALIAIIQNGSNTYYVWSNIDEDTLGEFNRLDIIINP